MRIVRALWLAAGAALLATPAAAQQASEQENLDCAVWSAVQVGTATDDSVKNSLSIAVAWFIGLYEGQTGTNIDKAFAARAAELDDAAVAALSDRCVTRFMAFAERLATTGSAMTENGS